PTRPGRSTASLVGGGYEEHGELVGARREESDVEGDAEAADGAAPDGGAIRHRRRIISEALLKSSLVELHYGEMRGCGDRSMPAPKRNSGGMLIGKRPVIGASPSSAGAAADCDTGNPPHATR